MRIKFFSLPSIIQVQIVEKMDIKDFMNFDMSTKKARNVINSIRTSVIFWSQGMVYVNFMNFDYQTWSVTISRFSYSSRYILSRHWAPLRIRMFKVHLILERCLTEEFASTLVNLFRVTKSTAYRITGDWCSLTPDSWETFLNLIGVDGIRMRNLELPYFQVPAVRKMKYVYSEAPLGDEDFLALNSTELKLTNSNVSSSGINAFIKKVVNGRPLFMAEIETDQPLYKDVICAGLWDDTDQDAFFIRAMDRRQIRVQIYDTNVRINKF